MTIAIISTAAISSSTITRADSANTDSDNNSTSISTVDSASSITPLPDGGYLYTYNIDGVENYYPVPPDNFKPLEATDTQLEEYGFQPRPTDPAQLQNWTTIMKNYKHTAVPGKIQIRKLNKSSNNVKSNIKLDSKITPSDDMYSSWGGDVSIATTNYVAVSGNFIQPSENTSAQHHSSAVSSWVGLGGYYPSSPGLVQCGTITYTKPSGTFSAYCAPWYEYNGYDQINPCYVKDHNGNTFTIKPGDSMYDYCYFDTANNRCYFEIADNNTGDYYSSYVSVNSADYDGSTAEWINEQGAPYLLDCNNVNWTNCFAYTTPSNYIGLYNTSYDYPWLIGGDSSVLMSNDGSAYSNDFTEIRNPGVFFEDTSKVNQPYYPGYPN